MRDYTGQRIGFVRVLGFHHKDEGWHTWWNCECICGNKIIRRSEAFTETTNCGCKTFGLRFDSSKTHSMSKSRIYKAWSAMVQRCRNPSASAFKDYGGRGIIVCDRWADSFDDFLKDMGPRTTSKHTLERVDNEKGYEPNNCRWATRKEQQRNRRGNRILSINGRSQCISAWAEESGLSVMTLQGRLLRGWDAAMAISTPIKTQNRNGRAKCLASIQ